MWIWLNSLLIGRVLWCINLLFELQFQRDLIHGFRELRQINSTVHLFSKTREDGNRKKKKTLLPLSSLDDDVWFFVLPHPHLRWVLWKIQLVPEAHFYHNYLYPPGREILNFQSSQRWNVYYHEPTQAKVSLLPHALNTHTASTRCTKNITYCM